MWHETVEDFENKMAAVFIETKGKSHLRKEEFAYHPLLLIEIHGKIESTIGGYHLHLSTVFLDNIFEILYRQEITCLVGSVF
jgi:hypothetical protein